MESIRALNQNPSDPHIGASETWLFLKKYNRKQSDIIPIHKLKANVKLRQKDIKTKVTGTYKVKPVRFKSGKTPKFTYCKLETTAKTRKLILATGMHTVVIKM